MFQFFFFNLILLHYVPGGIRTPDRRLSLPLWFSPPANTVCSLDYNFTISGATRLVSTEPHDNHMIIL